VALPSSAEVTLEGTGPGQELVAHLGPVLEGLRPVADTADAPRPAPVPRAPAAELIALFDAQATSRWLDVAARRMRALRDDLEAIRRAVTPPPDRQ